MWRVCSLFQFPSRARGMQGGDRPDVCLSESHLDGPLWRGPSSEVTGTQRPVLMHTHSRITQPHTCTLTRRNPPNSDSEADLRQLLCQLCSRRGPRETQTHTAALFQGPRLHPKPLAQSLCRTWPRRPLLVGLRPTGAVKDEQLKGGASAFGGSGWQGRA